MAKRRFQFHLSTALIWMLVGSAFMGFNYRSYKVERLGTQGILGTLNSVTEQVGWPFTCVTFQWNNFSVPPPTTAGTWRIKLRKHPYSISFGLTEFNWTEYTTTDLNLINLALNAGVLFGVIFILKWIFNSSMLRRKGTNAFAQS